MRYLMNIRQWLAQAGTALLPGYAFLQDNDTGMFRQASNVLSFSAGGVEGMRINSNAGNGLYTGSGNTTDALSLVESTHATSRRAAATFGTYWRMGQDNAASGTRDHFLYNINTAQLIWVISPTTNVLDFKVAPTINGVAIGTGSGSVSSITFNSPLSGGTISTTGSVGVTANAISNSYLATMAANTVKMNATGGVAAPTDVTVTTLFDVVGSTRGMLHVRGASTWSGLAVGGSNTILRSNGTDPSWASMSTMLDTISSTQGAILYRNASTWTVLTPGTSGYYLTSNGAGANPSYTAPPTGVTYATTSELRTGTATNKAVDPATVFNAAAVVALTPGTTVNVDMNTGYNFSLAAAQSFTLANPTNAKVGQTGFIRILQDATGSRTITYSSSWKFPTGAFEALSTAAGSIDVIFYTVYSSTEIYCSLQKAYA
jgi:hypothetical protein